jgi:hypothetical protein
VREPTPEPDAGNAGTGTSTAQPRPVHHADGAAAALMTRRTAPPPPPPPSPLHSNTKATRAHVQQRRGVQDNARGHLPPEGVVGETKFLQVRGIQAGQRAGQTICGQHDRPAVHTTCKVEYVDTGRHRKTHRYARTHTGHTRTQDTHTRTANGIATLRITNNHKHTLTLTVTHTHSQHITPPHAPPHPTQPEPNLYVHTYMLLVHPQVHVEQCRTYVTRSTPATLVHSTPNHRAAGSQGLPVSQLSLRSQVLPFAAM